MSGFWITVLIALGLAPVMREPRGSIEPALPAILVVVGAEGTPDYGRQFAGWAQRWHAAAEQAAMKCVIIGQDSPSDATDRERLLEALDSEPKEGLAELWLVLIGHGTYDGRSARFNLRGPDIAESELREALDPFQRPVAVINCASSSGPFINKISAPSGVVITATKSGNEQNFARFGDYLSAALTDPAADFDKDGQTSLLEAFLAASRKVGEFYQTEARLATEHALLDDNGDGLGTPGDWFRGIRAIKRAKDGATHDGHRAHQFVLVRSERERHIPPDLLGQRNRLELDVAELREKKQSLAEADYYGQLEALLLQLARIHQEIRSGTEYTPR